MKKNFFFITFTMTSLFMLLLVTGLVEHHPLPSVHAGVGLLLMLSTGIHLWLHRGWIKMAVWNWSRVPRTGRTNAILALLLLAGYGLCCLTGLLASEVSLRLFAPLHLVFVCEVVSLQVLHLVRHRKWFFAVVRAMPRKILPV